MRTPSALPTTGAVAGSRRTVPGPRGAAVGGGWSALEVGPRSAAVAESDAPRAICAVGDLRRVRSRLQRVAMDHGRSLSGWRSDPGPQVRSGWRTPPLVLVVADLHPMVPRLHRLAVDRGWSALGWSPDAARHVGPKWRAVRRTAAPDAVCAVAGLCRAVPGLHGVAVVRGWPALDLWTDLVRQVRPRGGAVAGNAVPRAVCVVGDLCLAVPGLRGAAVGCGRSVLDLWTDPPRQVRPRRCAVAESDAPCSVCAVADMRRVMPGLPGGAMDRVWSTLDRSPDLAGHARWGWGVPPFALVVPDMRRLAPGLQRAAMGHDRSAADRRAAPVAQRSARRCAGVARGVALAGLSWRAGPRQAVLRVFDLAGTFRSRHASGIVAPGRHHPALRFRRTPRAAGSVAAWADIRQRRDAEASC